MSENQVYDYKTIAENAYQSIIKRFDPKQYTDSYWDLGNVFDTMSDYVAFARGQSDPGLAKLAYQKYQALINGQDAGCWYDDFGWWGIASVKAYDKTFNAIFGDEQMDFQEIARNCWKTMNGGKSNPEWTYNGAPNVWDNRDDGHPDENYWNAKEHWATPRFGNGVGSGLQGVWQYDMFHVQRQQNECSPSNPSAPNNCMLGPYQNTVVNGLYFVLALRLMKVHGSGVATLQPVKDEYGFLTAWFDESLKDKSLLLRFSDDTMLVRERVTTYAEIDGEFPPVKTWDDNPDTCWAGDQGLIIGGLADYYSQIYPNPGIYILIRSIILGVANHMSSGGVIQYSYQNLGDAGDYKCGVGVFMRYLLYTFNRYPAPVKDSIAQIKNALLATTDSMCDMSVNDPYGLDLFDNFNILSTLTTAKKLGIISF